MGVIMEEDIMEVVSRKLKFSKTTENTFWEKQALEATKDIHKAVEDTHKTLEAAVACQVQHQMLRLAPSRSTRQ